MTTTDKEYPLQLGVRITPEMQELLALLAEQETERRGIKVTASWLVRWLIEQHAVSHLNNDNRAKYAARKAAADRPASVAV